MRAMIRVDSVNKRITIPLFALLALVFFQQCGDKSTDTSDKTPPAAVNDLAVGSATDSSLTLSWTAPGDDGTQGQAAEYDLRYYLNSITANNWDSATVIGSLTSPATPGTGESYLLNGLDFATTYYFAIKTADEIPNWSALSNSAVGTTLPEPDSVAPGAITDLQIAAVTASSVTLAWTAPGDDANSGTAAAYDIRFSLTAITDENFHDADSAENTPIPSPAGAQESATIAGLAGNTDYYFAITTADERDNLSAISNVAFGITLPGPTDSWERTYGTGASDAARSVVASDGAGYVTAGWTKATASGNEDFYVLSVDEVTRQLWDQTFGGDDIDYAWSISPTLDAGFIVGGLTYSFGAGNSDIQLVKLDGSGNIQWNTTYGGPGWDEGYAVRAASDGGYVVVGWTKTYGLKDLFVVRTNSVGDTAWTRQFGGAGNETGYDIYPFDNDGFIAVGMTESYGAGQQDVYVVRIDAAGDSLWTRTVGGADRDFATALTPSGDGGYVLAGATRSFGVGGFDMYAVKIDAAGDSVWAETYGGGGDEYAWAIARAQDGGYVLAGETDSFGAGQTDVYLIKIDASGQLLWQRTFGGALSDVSYSVAPLANGGFIVAGWTKSSGAGSGDIYLIKVDDQGE